MQTAENARLKTHRTVVKYQRIHRKKFFYKKFGVKNFNQHSRWKTTHLIFSPTKITIKNITKASAADEAAEKTKMSFRKIPRETL
jgi:hypothetical protein